MNKLGIRFRTSKFARIDDILKKLCDEEEFQTVRDYNEIIGEDGTIVTTCNAYNPAYWRRFTHFLSIEDAQFVLSFPQQGNWNYRLYDACQKKVEDFIEDELIRTLGLECSQKTKERSVQ